MRSQRELENTPDRHEEEWEESGGSNDARRRDDPDVLTIYLRSVRRIPRLKAGEEFELSRRFLRGDQRAKARMIVSNLRLVISIAKRYQGLGLSLPDLVSEGNLGLIRAVEKFDPNLGFRFSTYASKWIRQAVTRALVNQSRTVRMPANVVELVRHYYAVERRMEQSEGRRIPHGEILARMRLAPLRAAEVLNAARPLLLLDSPVGDDPGLAVSDVIEDRTGALPRPDAKYLLRREVAELIETLETRERKILVLRFGLSGRDPMTLEEIGRVLNLTKERIRQIEKKALGKLRALVEQVEGRGPAAATFQQAG